MCAAGARLNQFVPGDTGRADARRQPDRVDGILHRFLTGWPESIADGERDEVPTLAEELLYDALPPRSRVLQVKERAQLIAGAVARSGHDG